MAVDFNEMPFTDGLSNGFDGMTGVTADGWQNQIGDTDFILQNAEYSDNTITLSDSNIGYLPVAEPAEYTAYILCKTYIPTYKSGWGQIFGCRNGTNRCYVGTSMNSSTSTYMIRTYSTSTYVNPTMDNWHLITVKRTGGYYYVYADGELIISEANTATTRGDKFMIKSITDKGSTPTVDEAITVNIKCCIICDTAHTDLQIQNNADWLLIQYGFKNAPLDSQMSGADAAAIAWCIARNMEQTQSIEMQKKMYRKGLKQGVDGGAEIDEPWETTDTTIDIPVDEDGFSAGGDIGFTDLSKGIAISYANPDDPTDTMTIKISLYHDKDTDNGTYGRKGYLAVKKYNSAGEELSVHQGSFLVGGGHLVYHLQWNTANTGYPQYFTDYKINIKDSGGSISGYFVTPTSEGWTTGSSGVGGVTNPQWGIPDGYVYVGASNIL